jgi:hypothetical protein
MDNSDIGNTGYTRHGTKINVRENRTYCVVYFCFVCLRPVYPMLPVSLDCQFLIAPSVFSNIYYRPVSCVPSVASFSGLSIFD